MPQEMVPYWRSPADTLDIWEKAFSVAQKLASTEFVPSALRNRPDAIMAAILAGREVGLQPIQSLNQIAIIDGRPALSAQSMRALIQAHGHQIWADPEPTQVRCTMHLQRKGETHTYTSTWTKDDVQRAGLAGKPVHQRYPKQMLVARATGDIARLGAADVLAGMPYLQEELQDGAVASEGFFVESENGAAEPAPPRQRRKRDAPPAPTTPTSDSQPQPTASPSPDDADTVTRNGDGEHNHTASAEDNPSVTPNSDDTAGNIDGGGGLSVAQRIAVKCRELELDRYGLIKATTGKDRARDVSREEADNILKALKLIEDGEAILKKDGDSPTSPWTLVHVSLESPGEENNASSPNQEADEELPEADMGDGIE